MNFFKKLTAPKEVRAILGILDEIACARVSQSGISIPRASTWHDSEAFQIVRNEIEKMIFAQPHEFVRMVQNGTPPRQWVWSVIANIAGHRAGSGHYHIYSGFLNPMGPGEELVQLFDMAIDELSRMGATQPDYAREQKAALRKNIKDVG